MSNNFNRKDYWNLFPVTDRESVFSKSYTKSFLLHDDFFDGLKTYCLKALNDSIPSTPEMSWDELLVHLNGTKSFAVKKNKDIFHNIEKLLLSYLSGLNLLSGIKGLEFPVNLRVVHGTPPGEYLNRSYPTDFFHTDIWAGEPSDIVLGFIYLAGDVKNTSLDIYEPLDSDLSIYEQHLQSYKEIDFSKLSVKKIEYQPQTGQLIMFDGITPHRTLRQSGSVRISLDFRMRRADPYLDIEKAWDRKLAPLSRYWSLNISKNKDFDQKCAHELSYLKENHLYSVYQLRKNWCKQIKSART